MKEAFRSLVHIAAIAALTLLVAIAVIALLMATGCSEVSRDERPSIFILDGGEVEQIAIPSPVPLTAQTLYDDFKANATPVPVEQRGRVFMGTIYDSQYHGKPVTVTGPVVQIEDNHATLGVDTHGYGKERNGLFGIELQDLSPNELESLREGQEASATCLVTEYFTGSVIMKTCKLKGDTQ